MKVYKGCLLVVVVYKLKLGASSTASTLSSWLDLIFDCSTQIAYLLEHNIGFVIPLYTLLVPGTLKIWSHLLKMLELKVR